MINLGKKPDYARAFLIFILLFGIIFIFSTGIYATENQATSKISPTKNVIHVNQGSIQDAIDKANPGDTIQVNPGTYSGGINVNKQRLTLKAQGKVIIDSSSHDYGFVVNQPGNTIDGFKIDQTNGKAILVQANRCNLSNNYINNTNGNSIEVKGSFNNIQGNTITLTFNGTGIEVIGDNNLISKNNVLQTNSGWGITSQGNNIIINKNRVDDATNSGNADGIGILVESSAGITKIFDNQVNKCQYLGINVNNTGCTFQITNNHITNTSNNSNNSNPQLKMKESAISAYGEKGITVIDNNTIDKSGADGFLANGILMEGNSKFFVKNNQITNIWGISILMIHVDDLAEIQIIGNSMDSKNGGIGYEDGGGKSLIIQNNTLTQTGTCGICLNSNPIKNILINNNNINYAGGGAIFSEIQNNHCIITNNKIYKTLKDEEEDSVGIQVNSEKCQVTITNNQIIRNEGQGIIIQATNSNFRINHNTLTGNSGTGISLDTEKCNTNIISNTIYSPQAKKKEAILLEKGTAILHFNLLLYPYGIRNKTSTSINATNNWWGSNYGPQWRASKTVQGTPWLILNTKPNPPSIPIGTYSTLTANITHNSTGKDTSRWGSIPNGTPLYFATNKGIIKPNKSTTLQGRASTTYQGTVFGTALIIATVNNEKSETFIKINNSLSINQLTRAAAFVQQYYKERKYLPAHLSVGGRLISMPQFLQLLVKGTINLKKNILSPLPVQKVNPALNPTEYYNSGLLSQEKYVQMAYQIKNFIYTYGRAPNYISTSLGLIPFPIMVYIYSQVLDYYGAKNRLPPYILIEN